MDGFIPEEKDMPYKVGRPGVKESVMEILRFATKCGYDAVKCEMKFKRSVQIVCDARVSRKI